MVVTLIPWLKTGAQLQDEDGIELLHFDSDIDESHELACRIAEHPVERGTPITDHVSDEPDRLTINGLFTDTPLDILNPEVDRSRKLFQALEQLKKDKEPMTIVTGLRVYSNMVIESISVARSAPFKYEVNPSVSFKEIRIANQLTITIPEKILKPKVQNKGTGTVDTGQQGTDEATEQQDEENSSLLYKFGGSDLDFSGLAGFP